MDRDTYLKNRRVFFLYSSTITCIVIGLFLHYGKLVFVSDQISQVLASIFIIAGYFLLLRIASRLKKKKIHGLSAIAWASFLLFTQGSVDSLQGIWWRVLQAISIVLLVYFLVDGVIRFVISLIMIMKTAGSSEEKTIDSIDTVVAVATSLIAIAISIIEIC